MDLLILLLYLSAPHCIRQPESIFVLCGNDEYFAQTVVQQMITGDYN